MICRYCFKKCLFGLLRFETAACPTHARPCLLHAGGGCQVYEAQLVGLMRFVGLEEDQFLLGLSGAGGSGGYAGTVGRGGKNKRCLSSSFSSFSSSSASSVVGGGGRGNGRKRRRRRPSSFSSSSSGANFDVVSTDHYSPNPNKKSRTGKTKEKDNGSKRMMRCRSSSFSTADGLPTCSSPPSTSSLKRLNKMDKRMPVGRHGQNEMNTMYGNYILRSTICVKK